MDNNDRMRQILIGRLESLERAGVLQLPKARPRKPSPAAPDASPTPQAGMTVRLSAVAARADDEHRAVEPGGRASVQPSPPPPAHAPVIMPPAAMPLEIKQEESPVPKPSKSAWATSERLFDSDDKSAIPSSRASTLEILRQEVASCTRCRELATTRTQTVFGVGNPRTRLCFMGEAPGADEDRLGEPFVGRGGQLLNKIIEACQLQREEIYILNMLKCRPPGNRNPLPDELANCRPYLERQLELIEPEFICCLGAVASQNLLGTTTPIGKLRGKLHSYRGAKVVCTFHPAYLLRNPAAKKDCWDDMKFLMRQMGVEL